MQKLLYTIIVLVLIDIWVGVNLANHQSPFSNPFASPESRESMTQSIKKSAKGATDLVERKIDEVVKPGK